MIGNLSAIISLASCHKIAESQPVSVQPVPPQTIVRPTDVRPLPGKLDNVPMVNSNSPEWLKKEGILLSTFPAIGKADPKAHLGYPLSGQFEYFDHHYILNPPDLKTIYIGIVAYNPGRDPIQLTIPDAASNLVLPLPGTTPRPYGDGTRVSDAILKGVHSPDIPKSILIPPQTYRMLLNQPIPVKGLKRPLNGRSTHLRLNSRNAKTNEPALIYVASLAMYAKFLPNGQEQAPTLTAWTTLLNQGNLAQPRDKTPTPPQAVGGSLVYGRVSGVQQGSRWAANLTSPNREVLNLPTPDKPISYALSTLRGGNFGTKQVQAATLLVRYGDTAYEAHGNYDVHYDLTAPLYNNSDRPQTVKVFIETPLNLANNTSLTFHQKATSSAVFAGLVRLRYKDDTGQPVEQYVTVKQQRGQITQPLLTVALQPKETRPVQVDFLYPPDSTPPQVLT
ncbi:MAG: DUF3370 domain-containing protein, partial [Thermosynechococcaceae cyanobacterium]